MAGRALVCGLALAVLLVFASLSAPVELWVAPTDSRSSAPARPAAFDPEPSSQRTPLGDRPHVEAIGTAVIVGLVIVGLVIATIGIGAIAELARPRSFRIGSARWRPRWARPTAGAVPLPEPDAAALSSGMDAARTSLAEGPPRDGVVACWMELEKLGSSVGLERRDAETSAEYVERVVGVTPRASGSISTLAELYREARFSDHRMDEEARALASEALAVVRHELTQETVS